MDDAVSALMSDISAEIIIEEKPTGGNALSQWANVFYGVLVAPVQTMSVMADSTKYKTDGIAVASAFAVVLTSCMASAIGASAGSIGVFAQLGIAFCTLSGLLYWSAFSILLSLFCRFVPSSNQQTSAAFVVTGWAFLPIYFINTAKCFFSVPTFGWFLMTLLIVWFIAMQCVAVQSLLKISFKPMFSLLVGIPLLYKLTFVSALVFLISIAF